MLTPDEKKELQRKRGEGLHQWVLRINGYFRVMTTDECSTALFNIVQEAYNTGAKERGKSSIRQEAKTITLSGRDKKPKKKKVTIESSIIDKMELPVSYTKLSQRALNVLQRAGIQTIGEIVQLSRDELRNIRGAGTAFIFEIENMLDEYGLSLNGGKS